jgi:hypothetical protein
MVWWSVVDPEFKHQYQGQGGKKPFYSREEKAKYREFTKEI